MPTKKKVFAWDRCIFLPNISEDQKSAELLAPCHMANLVLVAHEPNQQTANQQFCHCDFVPDFVAVISSPSEGEGKKALGIVKYFYNRPLSQLESVGSR